MFTILAIATLLGANLVYCGFKIADDFANERIAWGAFGAISSFAGVLIFVLVELILFGMWTP